MPSTQLTAAELAAWSDTRQPAIYVVCALLLVLGNASVPLRIWAQWRIHKKVIMEDYFLIAALIFANVVTISTMVAASNGLGLHIWRVEKQDPTLQPLVKIFSCIWVTALFNGPSLFATKVALLLYYRRLFVVNQTWLKITWWANLIYVILWALAITLFYILQCSPVNYYWERVNPYSTIQGGSCTVPLNLIGIPLILSAVSDFSILLLPIITVLGLKLNLQLKLGLTAVFSVGFLSFACAVARICVLLAVTDIDRDQTWSFVPFELLNAVELTFAIICASAVPIFSRVRQMFLGQRSQNSYNNYGYQMQSGKSLRGGDAARLPSSSSEHLSKDYSGVETRAF
ncbi:uncharacterized protein N7459_002283 [Penicillium hispanicum]|uniref:uncharacterized protein n=1 Tax=Penicillium hispanicum TaxID=1080232 RepID=UPI00253F697F|nr:uncharacterized protein N7459_002283 [Penicillium hispanicum]KAJ5591914.1 hypothetical protein N7459_002283 [Penicillium hispanicum]